VPALANKASQLTSLSAFGLPLAPAAERRYVGKTRAMTTWRIVAQGRLQPEEVATVARGSQYFVGVMRGSYAGIALAAVALVLITIETRGGKPAPFPLVIACVFGLLGLLPIIGARFWSPAPPPSTLYDIDETALKVTAAGATRVVLWDALNSFGLRPDGIWLYGATPSSTMFIPRRFLSSADLNTLSHFLEGRLKQVRAEDLVWKKQARLLAWVLALGLALAAYQFFR